MSQTDGHSGTLPDQGVSPEDGEHTGAGPASAAIPGRSFSRTLSLGAIGCLGMAAMGMLAWIPGWGVLGSLGAEYIPMAPSTAVCFILLAAAILMGDRGKSRGISLGVVVVMAALASVFGLLDAVGYLADVDLNFEDAIVPHAGHLGGVPVARMSPSTGAAFALAGLGVLLLSLRRMSTKRTQPLGSAAGILGSVVILSAVVVILSYLYGTPLLYGGGAIPMAAPTAIAFLFLGISQVAGAGANCFPLRMLTGPSTRSRLMRAFLPLGVLAALVGGTLVHLVPAFFNLNIALIAAGVAILVAVVVGLIVSSVARAVGDAIDRAEARRKQAEAALRESEECFQRVIQSCPMGVFVCELKDDGRLIIVDSNQTAARLTGFDSSTMRGSTIEEAFPSLVGTDIPDRCRLTASEGQPWNIRDLAYNDSGIHAVFDVHAFRTSPGRMAVMFNDVSQRKRAEEERRLFEAQLQHAQKLESLGVLAGGIAHDFNNLLMAILGNADLALTDMSPVSPLRDNLIEIKTASLRAADLAKQMLAYSGKGKFIVEPLDLSAVVEEMGHMLEVSASKKAILKYDLDSDLPAIEADATQVRQVVMNLIINASEAIGPKSGIISITTSSMRLDRKYLQGTYLNENLPDGPYVTLEVADTGCGMDKDTQARIFDPFYTTKFTGRGLGMAAVLGIVRGHGGAIKIYSEVGEGTTMKVLFPASEIATARKKSQTQEQWHGPSTVLLVDDEITVCSIGQTMLEHLGVTVLTAHDGREALDVFLAHRDEIDCIILDLTMPNMDGEQAFRELRGIDPDVRVIMSSGYNQQEVTQRFVGKHLAGFIQKPYELETLSSALQQALGQ